MERELSSATGTQQNRLDWALQDLSEKNISSSVPILEGLVREGFRRDECLYYLGVAMLIEDKTDAAKMYFNACLQANSQHFNALYQLGDLEHVAGNMAAAKIFFLQVISACPTHDGATEKLRSLGVDIKSPARDDSAPPARENSAPPAREDSALPARENSAANSFSDAIGGGIYDVVLADSTPFGKQVLNALDSIELNTTLSRWHSLVRHHADGEQDRTILLGASACVFLCFWQGASYCFGHLASMANHRMWVLKQFSLSPVYCWH